LDVIKQTDARIADFKRRCQEFENTPYQLRVIPDSTYEWRKKKLNTYERAKEKLENNYYKLIDTICHEHTRTGAKQINGSAERTASETY